MKARGAERDAGTLGMVRFQFERGNSRLSADTARPD
jgi:hypothetical protein